MATRNSPLDFRVISSTALIMFVPWLLMVFGVTLAGYPGVVCITPLAWVMALPAGSRIAARSNSTQASQRLIEAALTGAVIGLLQGILFIIVVPRMGPIAADERASALGLSLAMVCAGIPVAAVLSVFTAWMAQRRSGVFP